MKKILNLILLAFMLLIFTSKVMALEVSDTDIKLNKGDKIDVTISTKVDTKVSRVEFTLVYSTYDIYANFFVNELYKDNNPNGIRHVVVLPENTSGNITLGTIKINVVNNPKDTFGTINIYNAKAFTSDEEVITLDSKNININVVEETTNNNKNEEITPSNSNDNKLLLKEIKSDIVTINLVDNVFEYQINIGDDIDSLDLEAIPIDDTYNIEISNQKIKELEDNKIIITVSDDDGNTTKYTIKVNVLTNNLNINIDDNVFEGNNSYKKIWIVLMIFFLIVICFCIGINKSLNDK